MAEWRYFDGKEEFYSGCDLDLGGPWLFVSPNRPGHGFMYQVTLAGVGIVDPTNMPTREQAQRAALDALITQLDAWKAQAEAARVALDEVVE